LSSEGKTSRNRLISELGKALLKVNALKIGTFETSTGDITPYYIDLKKLASFPSAFSLAFECLRSTYSERSSAIAPEYLCGIPTMGLLLSTLLANQEKVPLLYPSKSHPRSVVGLLRPGARVLVIEDVSETGVTIRSAVQAIRSSGGIVSNALTLIDRSEGADKTLSEIGVILHHFTTIEELAGTMREKMALADEQEQALESRSIS